MIPTLDLKEIENSLLDDRTKGIPGSAETFRLKDIGEKGWHVLAGDMPLPLAVIREGAMRHNSDWMGQYLALTGASLCPHGKTTLSPQLFDLQIRDGAWGITASTANHVAVYRKAGVQRILLANQLVGKANILMIAREIEHDPDFDFYCLVDSDAGLTHLLDVLGGINCRRPLQLLIEIGETGGRTGFRDADAALALARRIKAAGPAVCLRGIETFEGVFDLFSENSRGAVEGVLEKTMRIAAACDAEALFSGPEILLTAGGSAYFDRVAEHFCAARLSLPVRPVLRSGCYLTHDSGFYTRAFARISGRSPHVGQIDHPLSHALEVCAYIQSRPEPGLAIANFGRRDASYDMGLPVPLWHYRPGRDDAVRPLAGGMCEVSSLNDQHAYVRLPETFDLQVGDIVGFGISHPCTTFDKWAVLYLVDDAYAVTGAVRTFF